MSSQVGKVIQNSRAMLPSLTSTSFSCQQQSNLSKERTKEQEMGPEVNREKKTLRVKMAQR